MEESSSMKEYVCHSEDGELGMREGENMEGGAVGGRLLRVGVGKEGESMW